MQRFTGRPLVVALCLVTFGIAAGGSAQSFVPRDIWPQVTASLDAGDIEASEKKLGQILDSGREAGIRRYPLYAESAAGLARSANKPADPSTPRSPEVSNWSIKAAARLDPFSPDVSLTAADLARDQGKWGEAIPSLFKGFGKIFTNYRSRLLARSDFIYLLVIALFCITGVFAVTLFFRYSRSAAHDFREMLVSKFRAGVTTVLASAILFLPIFLWLGPVWLMFYWFIIFFPYASTSERVTTCILLILLALVPVVLDWTAYKIAGVDSPIVRAAISTTEHSYHPETIIRLQALSTFVPEDPNVHLLLGNLEVQQGNEEAAATHYQKAIAANENLAGAHLNYGNLFFLNNDFPAAISRYEKAAEIEPSMAIAYYNQAVAAGEIYKFDQQGAKIEQAKKYDRSLVERLLANPPPQKIVTYDLPVDRAWKIAEVIASKGIGKEIYGNYAKFNPAVSFGSPTTIGSLLTPVLAFLFLKKRKKTGLAGVCIKCGRTFCPRCKSSRESATYCTQCIHIYLKRDGVSLDTKRAKLAEVNRYQGSTIRMKRIFASLFPGTGQIIEGSTLSGILILFGFVITVAIAVLIGRLAPVATPAELLRLVIRVTAVIVAVIIWVLVTLPVYKQRPLG